MCHWPKALAVVFMLISENVQSESGPLPWDKLNLVGEGKLTYWFWDVYQAQLFSQDGRYEEQRYPLALRLQYLRDFSKEELLSETEKQWQKLGMTNTAEQQKWLTMLESLWPDVRKNDAITLFINEHKVSRFYFNSELLGEVTEPDFSEAFLAIWLAENTSAPDVRKKLIAGIARDKNS